MEKDFPIAVRIGSRFLMDGATREVEKSEEVAVLTFETTPAKVDIALGLTINRGNFSSARIDVGVSVPCYLEDMEAAAVWARSFVTDRLRSEVESLRESDKEEKGY